MIWVGLTGGMGCGKSTALSFFKDLGAGVLSADEVVHNLYAQEEVLSEVKSLFGLKAGDSYEEVMSFLRAAVFKSPEKRKALEGLIHPKVRKQVAARKLQFEQQDLKIGVYEVPLLFEKDMSDLFDFTVCIGSDEEQQSLRLQLRNPNWSKEEILRRLKAQLPLALKRERSDFYIDNSGSLEELKQAVEGVFCKLYVKKQPI